MGNPSSQTQSTDRAPAGVGTALFLVAGAGLVAQISLTRVMSVAVSYHAAFLILAVVMLGLAASAVAVFLGMQRSERPLTVAESVRAAGWAAASSTLGLAVFVFGVARDWGPSAQVIQIVAAAAVFFPGFYWSGAVVALILAGYPRDVGRLYWWDLLGAAVGCLVVVPLLGLAPAPTVLIGCGAVLSLACLTLSIVYGRHRAAAYVITAVSLILTVGSFVGPEGMRLRHAKGQDQSNVLWERWNALARVTVSPEVPGTQQGLDLLRRQHGDLPADAAEQLRRLWQSGWGMSRRYTGPVPPSLWLQLDTDAGTPIIQGGLTAGIERLGFLSWDVTAVGHQIRPEGVGHAFIIGGGGGRDVLTALMHGAKHVTVAELNPAVVDAVQTAFADFSGRPYADPRVALHIGEARNFLRRADHRFDLIQMSMIDTWAAAMAGSLVLAENALYTQEAFDLYLDRLTEAGLLSVSRWYDARYYGETARVLVLVGGALRRWPGVQPERCVALVANQGYLGTAVATVLVKRSPFSEGELAMLRQKCASKGFDVLWPKTPGETGPPFDVPALLAGNSEALADPRFDLTAPTDDRPFFYSIYHPWRSWAEAWRTGDWSRGDPGSLILGATFVTLALASWLLVARPLRRLAATRPDLRAAKKWRAPLVYFACLGLGFMLAEVALIQRFILFLGHPSYALSVVLFALLLGSSCGSAITDRWPDDRVADRARWAAGLVVGLLLVTALLVPLWLEQLFGWTLPLRVAAAFGLIAPLALGLGMLFPAGARLLRRAERAELIPWLWGINGVAGVAASVLGMMLAMQLSYTVVLLTAMVTYALAGLMLWGGRHKSSPWTGLPGE